MAKHESVTVVRIPPCDVDDTHGPAYADARIPMYGSWGNVCKPCFDHYGCKLGLGLGQRLILAD